MLSFAIQPQHVTFCCRCPYHRLKRKRGAPNRDETHAQEQLQDEISFMSISSHLQSETPPVDVNTQSVGIGVSLETPTNDELDTIYEEVAQAFFDVPSGKWQALFPQFYFWWPGASVVAGWATISAQFCHLKGSWRTIGGHAPTGPATGTRIMTCNRFHPRHPCQECRFLTRLLAT